MPVLKTVALQLADIYNQAPCRLLHGHLPCKHVLNVTSAPLRGGLQRASREFLFQNRQCAIRRL